jgi:hypothetical protein
MHDVFKHFGSQAKTAEVLKVDRSAITHFVNAGGFSPKRALEIELLTEGKFKAIDLVVTNDGK